MPSDSTIDLTGRWIGYDSQHDETRPITARLEQQGAVLQGTMTDEVTDFEASVSDIALRESMPPGADEEVVARIRSLCPEAPIEPVMVMFHVPEESDVEGVIEGPTVNFLKQYRGQHFAGYRVGDVRIGALGEGQQVLYEGTLSPDGTEIKGRWQAVGDNLSPFHKARGDFVLRREGAGLDFDLDFNDDPAIN